MRNPNPFHVNNPLPPLHSLFPSATTDQPPRPRPASPCPRRRATLAEPPPPISFSPLLLPPFSLSCPPAPPPSRHHHCRAPTGHHDPTTLAPPSLLFFFPSQPPPSPTPLNRANPAATTQTANHYPNATPPPHFYPSSSLPLPLSSPAPSRTAKDRRRATLPPPRNSQRRRVTHPNHHHLSAFKLLLRQPGYAKH
nr:pectinesterase inhibitor 10-like [Arachis hypogaea]